MNSPGKVLAMALVGAIVIGIVVATSLLDAPSVVHAQHLDAARVQQLRQAQTSISQFNLTARHLPARVEDLWADNPYDRRNFVDPETGSPLEYRLDDERTYELCALFRTSSPKAQPLAYDYDWQHPQGHFCFVRHVEKQPPAGGGGKQ